MKGRAKTFKLNLAQGDPKQSWILDSSLYQWNLESGLQLLVGFRIS